MHAKQGSLACVRVGLTRSNGSPLKGAPTFQETTLCPRGDLAPCLGRGAARQRWLGLLQAKEVPCRVSDSSVSHAPRLIHRLLQNGDPVR